MAIFEGIGIGFFSTNSPSYTTGLPDVLNNIGKDIRIDIPTYTNSSWMTVSKACVQYAVSLGMRVVWGVSSNGTTITSSNFQNFKDAIMDAALWAQQNGVYEFQMGNEEELHNDNTTVTDADLRDWMIGEGSAQAKTIFTNGNVSLSISMGHITTNSNYVGSGKGNLDLIASNAYRGSTSFNNLWKTDITNLYNAFGQGCYLTEFGPSSTSLDTWSSNENRQANAIVEMMVFYRNLGIPRLYYFCYNDTSFGAYKSSTNTYRKLWEAVTAKLGRRFLVVSP